MGQFLQSKNAIFECIATDGYYQNICEIDGRKEDLSPVALANKLAPHIFGEDKTKFFFDVTGAQGVNDAIRFFRTATGRRRWFAFDKAFHGRHGESRDSSSSNPVHWNETIRNREVICLPYPATRCELDEALDILGKVNLKDFACAIYEPVQGEGGGMRAGRYLDILEKCFHQEGIFTISDEIQSGLGRCGEWFGYQKLGFNPDAVVLSKSLGSIVPVSAFAVRKDIADDVIFPGGKISGTFPMYPVGMAAANFIIKILEEEKLVDNARNLSPLFVNLLKDAIYPFDADHPVKLGSYCKVDGIGFYRSIKFFRRTGYPDEALRDSINEKLRDNGVWTYSASKSFPAIRFTPPLVSTKKDLSFLAGTIHKVTRSLG